MTQWTTTYSGLVSILEEYTEDDSTEFSSQVQGCINRAEERLLKDLDLSIFNKSNSTTTASGSSTTSKPVKTVPTLSIWFTAAAAPAIRKSHDFIQAYGGSGRPLYFFEDKDDIYWAPVPDDNYAIVVRQIARPTPLSASNTTNWLTDNVADLLLWASLVESEAFLLAPERVVEFQAYYAALLGAARGFWRENAQRQYEPVNPTPEPERTR